MKTNWLSATAVSRYDRFVPEDFIVGVFKP